MPPLNLGCFCGVPPLSWFCSHLNPNGFFAELGINSRKCAGAKGEPPWLLQTPEAVTPVHPMCCLCRSVLSSKLSSSLLTFFLSPILIPLLWFSTMACLRGANWGRLCACQAASTQRIYLCYGMWVNSCSWNEDRHCFPSPQCCRSPQPHSMAVHPGFAQAGHGLPLK